MQLSYMLKKQSQTVNRAMLAICWLHTLLYVQEEGLSKSVHTGGRSVQLSQGGGACGVGGESVCLRWPVIAAAGDVLRRSCCCCCCCWGGEVGGALLLVRIGGGGAAPPQLRQHRLQPPLPVRQSLSSPFSCLHHLWCSPLSVMWLSNIYNAMACVQLLRLVCGGAGRLLLLRLQGRPSAAAAPAGPPEIFEMACLPWCMNCWLLLIEASISWLIDWIQHLYTYACICVGGYSYFRLTVCPHHTTQMDANIVWKRNEMPNRVFVFSFPF